MLLCRLLLRYLQAGRRSFLRCFCSLLRSGLPGVFCAQGRVSAVLQPEKLWGSHGSILASLDGHACTFQQDLHQLKIHRAETVHSRSAMLPTSRGIILCDRGEPIHQQAQNIVIPTTEVTAGLLQIMKHAPKLQPALDISDLHDSAFHMRCLLAITHSCLQL